MTMMIPETAVYEIEGAILRALLDAGRLSDARALRETMTGARQAISSPLAQLRILLRTTETLIQPLAEATRREYDAIIERELRHDARV